MCWGARCRVLGLTSDECRVLTDGVCVERADVDELVHTLGVRWQVERKQYRVAVTSPGCQSRSGHQGGCVGRFALR